LANGPERTVSGRLFTPRWLYVLAYVALVFVLSAQPHLSLPGTWQYRDKLAHMIEYGGLGWLVYRAALISWPGTASARRALLTILAVSAIGACDEKSQQGVPGRDSSVYDWIADTVGVTLAQAVCLGLEKRRGAG
jgi:VanZ family protein